MTQDEKLALFDKASAQMGATRNKVADCPKGMWRLRGVMLKNGLSASDYVMRLPEKYREVAVHTILAVS